MKGLRVAAIVGVMGLVVAGIVLLRSGVGSEEPTGSRAGGSSPTGGSAATPSSSPSEQQGARMGGNGYSYALPKMWLDITANVSTSSSTSTPGLDTASGWGTSFESSRAHLIVQTSTVTGANALEAAHEQLRTRLRAVSDGELTDVGSLDLDGREAIGLRLEYPLAPEFTAQQTTWLVRIGDTLYTLTARRGADHEQSQEMLDSIYSSWKWRDSA